MLEKATNAQVTHTLADAVYEVAEVRPAELFEALAGADVVVDTIVQIGSEIVFSAPLEDRGVTAAALDRLGAVWSERNHLGKVSVAGAGLKGQPGVAARIFTTLRGLRIEPQFIATSPSEISFYVPQGSVEEIVAALDEALEPAPPQKRRRTRA